MIHSKYRKTSDIYFTRSSKRAVSQKNKDDKQRTEFLQAAFPANEKFHGNLVVGKEHTYVDPKGFTHTNIKVQKYYDINTLSDFDFDFGGRVNYYINSNPSCCNKADQMSMFSFCTIVMDVNFHGWEDSMLMANINQAVETIQNSFGKKEDEPMPNAIIFTGRGLQLWWFISQTSYKTEKAYKLVSDHLYGLVGDLFTSEGISCIQTRPSGFLRAPLTYNVEAETYGQMLFLHQKRIDIFEFIGKYLMEEAEKRFKDANATDFTMYNLMRMNALFKLTKHRISTGEWGKEGFRNNVIYCLYNCIIQTMSHEQAMREVYRLNELFLCSFSYAEIEFTLCTSRYMRYRFKTDTLLKFLNITEEEQKLCGLYKNRKEKTRSLSRITDEQKEMVCSLCKEGLSKKEIAKKAGISAPSVAHILKQNHLLTKKEKIWKKARKLILEGECRAIVLEKSGISNSSYYKLIEKIKLELQEKRKKEEEEKQKRSMILQQFKWNVPIKKIKRMVHYSEKHVTRILIEEGLLGDDAMEQIVDREYAYNNIKELIEEGRSCEEIIDLTCAVGDEVHIIKEMYQKAVKARTLRKYNNRKKERCAAGLCRY